MHIIDREDVLFAAASISEEQKKLRAISELCKVGLGKYSGQRRFHSACFFSASFYCVPYSFWRRRFSFETKSEPSTKKRWTCQKLQDLVILVPSYHGATEAEIEGEVSSY
jgi:hypothetical protein